MFNPRSDVMHLYGSCSETSKTSHAWPYVSWYESLHGILACLFINKQLILLIFCSETNGPPVNNNPGDNSGIKEANDSQRFVGQISQTLGGVHKYSDDHRLVGHSVGHLGWLPRWRPSFLAVNPVIYTCVYLATYRHHCFVWRHCGCFHHHDSLIN